MPLRWNRNRLTAKLGIDYPVIQGPLGGLSSQKLTAAVSNFGGLGSFGAHGLAPEAIKDVIGARLATEAALVWFTVCLFFTYFLAMTRIAKLPGFILPRRSPGAGASNSADGRNTACVFKSSPIVLALFFVGTFSITVYLSGAS